jgi:hypothetical protein
VGDDGFDPVGFSFLDVLTTDLGGKVVGRRKSSSKRVGPMTTTSLNVVTLLKVSLLQLPPPALMIRGKPDGGTFGRSPSWDFILEHVLARGVRRLCSVALTMAGLDGVDGCA